jgi:hypothetical protein
MLLTITENSPRPISHLHCQYPANDFIVSLLHQIVDGLAADKHVE